LKILSKISENKRVMIVAFILGVISYAYILMFRKPAILEIVALLFFALVIKFSSTCFFAKKDTMEEENTFRLPRLIEAILGMAVTLSVYFYIHR